LVWDAAGLNDRSRFGIGKSRLAGAQKHGRVHRAHNASAIGFQHTSRFLKKDGKIAQVFQHQAADDQVERAICKREPVMQIVRDKADQLGSRFAPRCGEHAFRKIHRCHVSTALGQPHGVSACPAAEIQDRQIPHFPDCLLN
jgi:hypothetical protein